MDLDLGYKVNCTAYYRQMQHSAEEKLENGSVVESFAADKTIAADFGESFDMEAAYVADSIAPVDHLKGSRT